MTIEENTTTPEEEVVTVEAEVEETEVEGENDKVNLTKEEYDSLVEQLAEATQARTNTVEELKELRKKKIPEAELPDEEEIEDIVGKKVNEHLSRREQEQVGKLHTTTLEGFIKTHPELFKSGNLDSFKSKLDLFNTDKATTKEEFDSIFTSAYKLAGLQTNKENVVTPSQPKSSSGPAEVPSANLSAKEKEFVQKRFNGDIKKFAELKQKRPDYVDTLLQWQR